MKLKKKTFFLRELNNCGVILFYFKFQLYSLKLISIHLPLDSKKRERVCTYIFFLARVIYMKVSSQAFNNHSKISYWKFFAKTTKTK